MQSAGPLGAGQVLGCFCECFLVFFTTARGVFGPGGSRLEVFRAPV